MILADDGDVNSRDDGCHIFFGVVRDCAYKIRREALQELEMHRMTAGRSSG